MDHAVLDIENSVENIERAVIVGDDDDPGLALVGDLGEKSMTCSPSGPLSAVVGSSARMRLGLLARSPIRKATSSMSGKIFLIATHIVASLLQSSLRHDGLF